MYAARRDKDIRPYPYQMRLSKEVAINKTLGSRNYKTSLLIQRSYNQNE